MTIAPRTAVAHRRQHRFAGMRGAFQVDVEDPVPVVVGGIEQTAADLHAGIRDEGVDSAPGRKDRARDAAARRRIGYIGHEFEALATLRVDVGRHARERVGIDVGDHDPRARRGETPRAGFADAGSGAGDDRDFWLGCQRIRSCCQADGAGGKARPTEVADVPNAGL